MSDTALDYVDEIDRGDSRAAVPAGRDDAAIDRVASRLTRRAVASLAIGLGLLIGVGATVADLVGRNEKTTSQIYVLSDIRATAAQVLKLALDAETGQRGYLITHSDAYLEPFLAASKSIHQTLDALSAEVANDPLKVDVIQRLEVELDEKFSELRQTVDLERAGRHADALAIVNSDAGNRQMDRIRALGEQLDGYLHGSLATAVAQETRTRTYMVSALAFAVLGIAGLSALLMHDLRRQLRRLNAARSRLRTMVHSLEARVARRTRELTEINQRFDTALQASGIVVFAQDRELTYTWLSHGFLEHTIEDLLGKSDAQVLPARALPPIERLKRNVLDSGQPARGEFSVERDGAVRWWNLTIVPALAADGTTVGVVGGAVDISARKETEARIRLLMSEVTHRAKNLLSVIQTIMRQTAMHSASVEDFTDRFTARLRSLAASHDLLVQEDWQGAALRDLVLSQLGPYSDPDVSQIDIDGTPLLLPPLAAQHIGMAMHELASNAVRYGALSVPEGRVKVAWRVTPGADGSRACELSWSESGGPRVTRPPRSGFGRVVIERTVARALDGKVSLDYAPDGVRWAITFPMAA